MGLCLHPWVTLSFVKLPHEAWLSNVQKVPRRCGSAGDGSSFYLVIYARVLCSSLEGYMHG